MKEYIAIVSFLAVVSIGMYALYQFVSSIVAEHVRTNTCGWKIQKYFAHESIICKVHGSVAYATECGVIVTVEGPFYYDILHRMKVRKCVCGKKAVLESPPSLEHLHHG